MEKSDRNFRNKSYVVGICWTSDGQRIAIAYADGLVIVGTLEGNRIWNKEFNVPMTAIEVNFLKINQKFLRRYKG